MTFWITSSIVLFLVVVISAYGPLFGLYGEMVHKEEEEERE
ncbi:hypothetical protein QWY16_14965 [Planococcus shenhongbingii]|uniref:Uncharacterized protein n=1 Tax=Planococcus shenhongbingii TaxID=3058398 RepID=A0ABT8N9W5_9BACL|nr:MULTISPECIES: hypothetical protein [unclassified Planococcus (in: firmicutes)]MDN7244641.1 hypothetical protein [Planococcus sp. N017]WKA57787.1 hypothetical protein QWY16_14965 [Planococcus sp. N016]